MFEIAYTGRNGKTVRRYSFEKPGLIPLTGDPGHDHGAEYRRCLIELDVAGMRKLSAHTHPHLAQPASDLETLTSIHIARTQARTLPLRLRQFSYKWLNERHPGWKNLLPEKLRKGA